MPYRYGITKHYTDGNYSDNFYCREFLYNNYKGATGCKQFLGVTMRDRYVRSAPLSNTTLTKMGYFFKRYLFKDETLEINSDGDINVTFVNSQFPAPSLISLTYLLRCYFLRWFNRKTDINYMLNKVLYSKLSRLHYDWTTQLGTTFYLWYVATQLEHTDYASDNSLIVRNSNGPGQYGYYLLAGYKLWNDSDRVDAIDPNIVKQFIEDNYLMLDNYIGQHYKQMSYNSKYINIGLITDAFKEKYFVPSTTPKVNW